ncbi:MAG: hypothetical protein ABIJ20_01350 [Nanoarchaeota archaeon]|nr:hypothetical protein [Nanoarchaeota archaeon]MBU1445325.1 hypothetical protein [Nanoarchaeota archaeon]MBU2406782.1 hypothetical protein [Nanoarchaeota archaeon]MBU2420526.1 hypothetical protein [Nanoarchaeota archaeon]MBU2475116.1 hypothetical protein [Nanoarchaeota archaeon]
MKKGQIAGQPIIFIFITIVIVILLFFGIKVILNSRDLANNVNIETFFLDIEEQIQETYNLDFGSRVSLKKISVPSSLKEICFMNLDGTLTGVTDDKELKLNAAKTNGNNVIIIPSEGVYKNKKAENFRVSINPLCENLNDGELDLVLESMGSYVEVKKV